VGFRHHRRAALLAADGEGDARFVERIEHREVALARHREDVGDAVGRELIHERLGGVPPAASGGEGGVWALGHRFDLA
jgi:hypothetical protein